MRVGFFGIVALLESRGVTYDTNKQICLLTDQIIQCIYWNMFNVSEETTVIHKAKIWLIFWYIEGLVYKHPMESLLDASIFSNLLILTVL